MLNKVLNFKLTIIFLLLILALPAAWPTIQPHFFSVHDEAQHILDIYEMQRALTVQSFPPRWAPDLNFGLGHPYFNFYYHLPFYITSIFVSLDTSLTVAFKWFMLVAIISGILGFYFFMRQHTSKLVAVLSATIYLYTPYFAVDLYVRGAFGELAVLAIVPWAAYAVNRVVTRQKLTDIALVSIILGLLGISHNVLNIFAYPLLFGYGIFLIFENQKDRSKTLLKLFVSFLLGFSLAAYYWLPAVVEKSFISNYEQIHIEDQFPFIKQLILPSWGYGSSHWGPNDEMSFQIGVLNLLAVVLSVIFIKFMGKNTRFMILLLVVFFTLFGLMNSRTLPIWNLSSFTRYVQFPWRLLLFTTFASAILAGLLLENIFQKFPKRIYIFSVLVLLAIFLINVNYFKPSGYKDVSEEKYLEMYFANRTFSGNGERGYPSKDYLNFAEDFLPPVKWQTARPKSLPKSLISSKSPADIQYVKKGVGADITVKSKEKNSLQVLLTYFPGWTVYLDGKKIPVSAVSNLGLISFDVPAGQHSVILRFENTLIRIVADVLSLVSLLVVIILLGVKINFRRLLKI